MPDHPTPLYIKTPTSDPVPFMIYDSQVAADGCDCLTEENARKTGVFIDDSTELMPMFLKYE